MCRYIHQVSRNILLQRKKHWQQLVLLSSGNYTCGSDFSSLRTDHSAITKIIFQSYSGCACARITQCQAWLISYFCVVEFIPGNHLPDADALSCLPAMEDAEDVGDEDGIIAFLEDQSSITVQEIKGNSMRQGTNKQHLLSEVSGVSQAVPLIHLAIFSVLS